MSRKKKSNQTTIIINSLGQPIGLLFSCAPETCEAEFADGILN